MYVGAQSPYLDVAALHQVHFQQTSASAGQFENMRTRHKKGALVVEALEKAVKMIEQGEVEKGLEELERLESEADHQEMYDIAMIYQQLGHAGRASRLVKRLLMDYPDEGELYILAAELSIDLEEEDEAIEWLLEISEEDESYIQAQMLLADLYQLQGLEEVAEQKLKNALESAPEEPVLLAGLGEFYLERGDYQKSIPFLKQAEQHGFEHPESSIYLRIAEAYSATGQFEEAMKYYEDGLAEKTELNALFGYGYTALQISDYETAVKQLEELRNLDYEYASLYPFLARAYEGKEQFDKALAVCQDGMRVDEFNDALYAEAGKIQLKLGNEEAAITSLREALSMNPGNVDAALSLLSALDNQEDAEGVLELVSYLREMSEDAPLFSWYEARAHLEEDDVSKALEAFQQASPSFLEDAAFLRDYGYALLEGGRREDGIHKLKQSLNLEEQPELQAFLETFAEDEM
ncbi:tetratricopeptide repeat protein [Salsuginibacillus halophilus]|uniref:tetratricopeptide repeat protein n=1 Tax=Salsuginibacillus halophilus TaxID=517424 RepID=UPI000D0DCEFB|nr:tetratricopeptide repeat protein [Salsuginibacillus halophilus]